MLKYAPHLRILQWGLHQGLEEEKEDGSNPLNPGNFKRVKLLGDGAVLFTRGMGMSCTWTTERGFGERSWRYAAVFNGMRIEKLFIEVRCPPNVAFFTSNFEPSASNSYFLSVRRP
jgi:hypothetical protein